MNEDEKRNEINEMTELLIRLRPARGQLDSRVVFYEAGFGAGQAESAPRRRPTMAAVIAAGLLVAVVTVPMGYRAGQTAAMRSVTESSGDGAAIDRSIDAASHIAHDSTADQFPVVEAVSPSNVSASNVSASNVSPDAIEGAGRSDLLAQWIDPLTRVAGPPRFEVSTETTLMAFHGTFVVPDDTEGDWLDFPFASTLARYRDFSVASPIDSLEAGSPMTVNDLQAMAQSLEASR